MRATSRIRIALAISIALHAAIFSIRLREKPPGSIAAMVSPPLTVTIVEPTPSPPEPPSALPPPPKVPETPPPRPRPVERPVPRTVPLPEPVPRAEPPPVPLPTPRPEPPTAPVDMLAAINARRAQRRAQEEALRESTRERSAEELAMANINRNLNSSPGEGVSGVFQILSKGTRRGEFAFNGWRSDQRRWREVIEVDAGLGGDVERAMVKRMIELIRSHYSGDFNWESHRLGRVVVLSARAEDQAGLEDFLMREFFGTQTLAR